jgi:two-component system phosphate regulon sensor histidine kinase PhoR
MAGFVAIVAFSLLIAANGRGIPAWGWAATLILAPAAAWLVGWAAFSRSSKAIDLTVKALSDASEQARLGQVVSNAGGEAGRLVYTYNRTARELNSRFQALESETARLQEVFDSVAEPIVAVSAAEDIAFMNAAAAELFDVPAHGPRRSFLSAVGDHELLELVRLCLREGARRSGLVTYGTRKVPLQATAMPSQSEAGDWAVVLVLTDLTEVRRQEQVRRELISNLSHELRTPLASIKAAVDTLRGGAVDDRAAAEEFLADVDHEVDRLTVMVEDLLQLSRIESGALQLKPRRVSIAGLLRDCIERTRPVADRKQIALEFVGEDITAEVDPIEFGRAVTNLLSNAVKFLDEGKHVWLSASADGGDLVVAVRDDGPGIDRADLPRLFERFYKADKARATEGAGLGLAIVKHIVQAHGGTVSAESQAGHGATFTIRLPGLVVAPPAAAVAPLTNA